MDRGQATSTDTTLAVARGLARELPEVIAVHLDAKGQGQALRAVWSANRRVTFRASGGRGAGHHQLRGLPVFLLALALTGGALALLQAATPRLASPWSSRC
jgi:hypothetical protein